MATIDTILQEKRVFPPPDSGFQKPVFDPKENSVTFWEKAAKELHWSAPWSKTLEWEPPFAKWFLGGKINASFNCLDRHLGTHAKKKALIWEGEDGSSVTWTYEDLHREVCLLSNVLENQLGLKAGDKASIYMPLIPQAIVAMLACARVGVTHSIIFAGFSASAIRDRVLDAECKVIFATDIGFRKGQAIDIAGAVREALPDLPCVNHVLVFQRSTKKTLSGKEKDWESLLQKEKPSHAAKHFDAEHPLFFLYTSGTTGKPKGIVHSTGGYLVQAAFTSKWVFDLKDSDIYWCTADIGWITGHSYVVYGPLANRATILIYEGAPMHPHEGRFWEIIDKHQVSILYTAPTAIRAFMRCGDDVLRPYSLKSLRLLGSVGEPINPEAWIWYQTKIGKSRCPIVDTWWQTETGAILISPLPGVTPLKPGSATKAFPGIVADIVDENGRSCGPGEGGYLVIREPWPSMLRTLYKNPERYKETYWKKFPGVYFTGDGAVRDEDGYFWIKGRVDDVINVSGHRLGTMEIESALVSHPSVAEAAVVGIQHELKGQAVFAFVTPKSDSKIAPKTLVSDLKEHVVKSIGALARPETIRLTKTLPKTRSGKIMRRLLRDVAENRPVQGDTTTLENAALVEFLD